MELKSTLQKCIIVFVIIFSISKKIYGQNQLSIIPQPSQIEFYDGAIILDEIAISINHKSLGHIESFLLERIENKYHLNKNNSPEAKAIELLLIDENWKDEVYELVVNSDKITIKASDDHGVFNGVQTLLQMIYHANTHSSFIKLPLCKINDQPRFSWRGFMLDESRHFYGKEKVKQTLELMAMHKLNVFHWHLTDAPGWRIEIKKYPKLTGIGAVGNQSNPNSPTAFYTQDEIREIVDFATDRFITVIPEIDMPGHLSAAMLAYPEYSGGGTEKYPNFTINPAKNESYEFLMDIIKELEDMFPAPYIHIGGDEVSFGSSQWAKDPDVIKLQEKYELLDLKEVEHFFIRRMYDSLSSLNKTLIGWDEVANAKIPINNSVVMWWRHKHTNVLHDLIQNNYQVVLCPRIPMYLDFVQDSAHQYGRRWQGEFCDLEKVYDFPVHLNIDYQNAKILGIQGNLWTNRISSEESYDYQTWPRLSAIAEAAWTDESNKDFIQFLKKLKKMHQVYDEYNLYYYDYFNPTKRMEPEGSGPQRWQENHR